MSARRLLLSVFAVMFGVLVCGSVPGLAAPPVAPEAPVTGKATGVTATAADLGGVLNPHAPGEAGFYYFAYAPRGAACTEYGVSAEEISAGFEKEPVAPLVEIAGLEPSTLYTFCLIARNEAGASIGSSETFTTLPAPPTVEGESASGVNSTTGTLEAQVNANNQVTSCEVQYGTTTAYSTSVPCEPASLEGFGNQRAALEVNGLTPGTTYHFRIVAENASKEKREGPDQAFTTVPTPNTDPVTAIAARTATFNGHLTLNPVDTQYSFEYKIGTECTGESTPTEDAGSGPGTLASPSEPVTGLIPATEYSVCFVAANAYGSAQGSAVSFITPSAAPTITGESVTEVTATSAWLRAEADPGGTETTFHFDYGTTDAYGQSTPESAPLGADNSQHPASAAIQDLQPGTTYHYRLVATNSKSPAGGTLGPDQTFTTQTTEEGFSPPDGRGYELVSPAQKDGAEILGIGGGGTTPAQGDATQASEDGTSVTYIANAPVGANPPGNNLATQVLSTRGAGGWSSQDIATPHKNSITLDEVLADGEEYLRFSSDLSRAVLVPVHKTPEPSLAPEVHQEVSGETEIYLRNDLTGVFQALLTTEPLPELNTSDSSTDVQFEGATPDLSHLVFEGPAGLDPHYPGTAGIYEWSDGHPELVSVLPKGEPAAGTSLLASDALASFGLIRTSATRYAVSNDGARIVWSGEGDLFTRDMATGETVQVDAATSGGGAGGGGVFQAASSNGSRVFFTDTRELTSGAPEGGLFMFDVDDGKLTDLTPDAGGGSFFQANGEGTSLYEVSSSVLPSAANGQGEVAAAGANNLYLLREAPSGSGSWSATFITAGMEEGITEGRTGEYVGPGASAPLAVQAARVSPNGRYLAFMSQLSLTGYDNRDANSGQPDEEVYLYAAETNRLVCASCDPTGARPVGEQETGEGSGIQMDPWNMWPGRWLAATIPGWTPDGAKRSTGYQPRYLSDSGRLFFDSADALVPHDVNGKEDVYEYEPADEGSCQPPSYGQSANDVFDASAGGCVGLISAGAGSADSAFFDATASGNDVFFTTQDGLVPQDKDGVADMYDARVCTQTEPCQQSLLTASPPCTTADSCRVAPSPQPGVFAAPASATFAGAGNVAPTPTITVKVKTKTKTAAQRRTEELAKALKVCKGRPKRKRPVCKAQARKKYGKAKTSGRRIK